MQLADTGKQPSARMIQTSGESLYPIDVMRLWALYAVINAKRGTQVYPRESVCVYAPDPRVWLEM